MIGFVEVKVDLIREAYQNLEKHKEHNDSDWEKYPLLSNRINTISEIMENSRGKKKRKYFHREDHEKLRKLLRETAYASFASEKDTMIIRIEMASIILDIIKIYKEIDEDE